MFLSFSSPSPPHQPSPEWGGREPLSEVSEPEGEREWSGTAKKRGGGRRKEEEEEEKRRRGGERRDGNKRSCVIVWYFGSILWLLNLLKFKGKSRTEGVEKQNFGLRRQRPK